MKYKKKYDDGHYEHEVRLSYTYWMKTRTLEVVGTDHWWRPKWDYVERMEKRSYMRTYRWGRWIEDTNSRWRYYRKHLRYYRRFAFKQEISQLEHDRRDIREEGINWKVRTCRWRSNWDDVKHSRGGAWTRSWKKAHKVRKQWMKNQKGS